MIRLKIYDAELKVELTNPDLKKGRLEPAKRFVEHHAAVERTFHYEILADTVGIDPSLPDGWRKEVEDTAAREAWDEYEDVQRYVLYTDAELAEIAEKAQAEKAQAEKAAAEAAAAKATAEKAAEAAAIAAAKAAEEAAQEEAARRDAAERINAQLTYTAMMTDTMLPEEG